LILRSGVHQRISQISLIERKHPVGHAPIRVLTTAELIGYGVTILEQPVQRVPTIVPSHAPVVAPAIPLVMLNTFDRNVRDSLAPLHIVIRFRRPILNRLHAEMQILWIPTLRIKPRLTIWRKFPSLVAILTEAFDLRIIDTPSVNCLFEIVRRKLPACSVLGFIPTFG
jgi:hypothetical protein